jgi:glycosyltransferase involved in cell wall biosynthesis
VINKSKNVLVSVIIPTYNRGWILKDAIESVVTQTFSDVELIVVDDGSTDNTKEILDQYKHQIKVIHQANKGVSAARNAGITASIGKYIAFLDSDDIWLPEKLSCQVDFFSSNPDAQICQTEEIWMKNGKKINQKKKHKKISGYIFERSLALCLVSPSAVMIKKNLFNDTGLFDESLLSCEDYDMWLKVSQKYPVYLINKPLIIKRGGHTDQLSAKPGLDKYRIQSLKKIIESNTLSDDQYKKAVRTLKEKCVIYAQGCMKRGKEKEAFLYNTIASSYDS